MKAFIFTGPTLSPEQACAYLHAVYLPPVSQGDVYRVSLAEPRAIGIIDGFFDQVPSVWHKEILWAMRRGIAVFGSASMGALRAAELAPFGMIGVGRIFEAFRSGELEDDDEVSIVHGPAATGFRPLSEAMVNIRATLARAEAERAITGEARQALERVAKGLFYAERTYGAILEQGARQGLANGELDSFRSWLPGGRVDQKREDAIAMLRSMHEYLAAPAPPPPVPYHFEHTSFWDRLVRSAGGLTASARDGAEMVPFEALLDELRLDARAYQELHQECLLRTLILEEARRRGYAPTREGVSEATREFRRHQRLKKPRDLARWLAQRQMTKERFGEWMAEEALIRSAGSELWRQARRAMPDMLRTGPNYANLMQRARKKLRLLSRTGDDTVDWENDSGALWNWYLGELSDTRRPQREGSILARISPNENEDFLRARARERQFRRLNRRPKGKSRK